MYRVFHKNYAVLRIERNNNASSSNDNDSNNNNNSSSSSSSSRSSGDKRGFFDRTIVTQSDVTMNRVPGPGAERISPWWEKRLALAAESPAALARKCDGILRFVRNSLDEQRRNSELLANASAFAYRRYYIQDTKLRDSCFYESVADQIEQGGLDTNLQSILDDMSRISREISQEETPLKRQRSKRKVILDANVDAVQKVYDERAKVERTKRAAFTTFSRAWRTRAMQLPRLPSVEGTRGTGRRTGASRGAKG